MANSTNQPAPPQPGGDAWHEDKKLEVPSPTGPGKYSIAVSLHYRKVDQFLLNFLFGEKTKLTSPVTEIVRATATVTVRAAKKEAAAPAPVRLATHPQAP